MFGDSFEVTAQISEAWYSISNFLNAATPDVLDESEMPKAWYNIQADLPKPLPAVLHPGTHKPVGPEDLAPLFPPDLIAQEVSQERYIEIPPEVQQVYKIWRPSPLYRARALEKALGTPAKIYYKYEGVSPTGSHKPNTAVPQVFEQHVGFVCSDRGQAFYNKKAGTKKLSTETGAGQWGSSLAFAGSCFGMSETKPYRSIFMKTFGAQCYPSPSERTEVKSQGQEVCSSKKSLQVGRKILENDPKCTGSLGIAISEAVESCVKSDVPTKYALGSVLNHVLMHQVSFPLCRRRGLTRRQTIIGQEAITQLEKAGDYPDVLVGCTGGGSNFAGMWAKLTFYDTIDVDKFRGEAKKSFRVVAVEPAACPSLTRVSSFGCVDED
eukprot:757305-Hanusia_phi.AAC.4